MISKRLHIVLALSAAFAAMNLSRAFAPTPDLVGLWQAKVRFGPDVRGALTILAAGDGWHADRSVRQPDEATVTARLLTCFRPLAGHLQSLTVLDVSNSKET